MRLISPTGLDIIGTREQVPGVALLVNAEVTRQADGKFAFATWDQTDMDWDGQTTATKNDERVFVDEAGNDWPESQLHLVEDDEGGE